MAASWEAVLVATATGWVGAFAAATLRGAGTRLLRPFVYLAVVFFGLSALFDILPESKHVLSWPLLLGAAAAGYATFWLIGEYIAPICPACAVNAFDEHQHHEHDHAHHHHHPGDGVGLPILAAVLAVHCFVDGLAVSAASLVDASFGARVLATIAFHKVPEGFALTLLLMAEGRTPSRALAIAMAVEGSTLAGALAATIWWSPSPFWLALALAHIGGSFLYLTVSGLTDAFERAWPAAVGHRA